MSDEVREIRINPIVPGESVQVVTMRSIRLNPAKDRSVRAAKVKDD